MKEQNPLATKVCSICEKEKNIDMYVKNRYSKTGYRSECKECGKQNRLLVRHMLLEKKRQYRIANREKIKEYKRKYSQKRKEKINAKSP